MSTLNILAGIQIKQSSMNEWYDTETMNILLTRDWFTDDESICTILHRADQEAWEWILQNKHKFSLRVQKNIQFIASYYSPIQFDKTKVAEISDTRWTEIQTKHIRDMEIEFERLWTDYIRSAPSRPMTKIDEKVEELIAKMNDIDKTIENHIDMQKKKYLTPAARLKNVDTKLQQFQTMKQTFQNELARIQTLVKELDESYHKNKKKDFRFKWLTSFNYE
jgi:hypothetical protein